jgi:quinol-cytochrome oxidoreductase complex cytochrome b subunit/Fe-S-cluster-containing hydrogenase component 2/coenzyme F420-reducing hydrogenase delta subunit
VAFNLHKVGRAGFDVLRKPLSRAFEQAENPLNYLGALTIYLLWIVLISGLWLLIFFRTSVNGAFDSVEYLTNQQWYLGGIMRSLHRYASDAAILTILLHVIKEFVLDRYRRNRWFNWVTGLPLIWIMFPLGISGYWLVWDQLGQYVAISSAELLDELPIFTDAMAGNFLSDDSLSDRFFTLMAFLHLIGLPIFLVFGIWLHVFRLNGPRINPPRRMMAATLIALLVLSLVFPAESHDKADLAAAPQVLNFDWYYLHVFPLIRSWSASWVWVLLVGISLLILVAPWLPPARKRVAAVVNLENCNGCKRCVDDCPFGAVALAPRSDGESYSHEAVVDPELCISCGICVGACPTATPFRTRSELVPGIDLPEHTAADLRQSIRDAGAALDGEQRVIVFACRGERSIGRLREAGAAVVEVICLGQLPPSYIDFVLSRDHGDGVLLLGCQDGDCNYRHGADWTAQRAGRERDPRLRRRVDDTKVACAWLAPWSDVKDPVKLHRRFGESL